MSDTEEATCLVGKPNGTMVYSSTNNPQSNFALQETNQQSQQHQSRRTQNATQNQNSESGDLNLIDYNDEFLLTSFHEDAVKQAGLGKFQLVATLIVGGGLSSHAIQVYSVFYVEASAEIEYCIVDTEKNWLGLINLLGLAIGSAFWSGFYCGRRKALLSCLLVSFIFMIISCFMPSYDLFMTTRFFAAVGTGGILPIACCYLCELTPSHGRARVLGILGALGIFGGLLFCYVGQSILPSNGSLIISEMNSEHFTSWHRYLLYCSLPTLISILGLFYLPESPRFLLENGREVEALSIYQRIYRQNRTRGGYSLTELELPALRSHRQNSSSVVDEIFQSFSQYFGGFLQLFNKSYCRTTIVMLCVWFSGILVFHGLTIYTSEYSRSVEADIYNQQTITQENQEVYNKNFSKSMDNMIFTNVKFVNCSFRRLYFNHVNFNNCSFFDTEFSNIKSSRTQFKNSTLQFVSFIDTDLTENHFIDCITNNLTILKLSSYCDRDYDYNIFVDVLFRANFAALLPSICLMLVMGDVTQRLGKSRTSTVGFMFAFFLCIAFGFLFIDTQIIWVIGICQGLILFGIGANALLAVDNYSTGLRCSALGLFICGGHLGALVGNLLYLSLTSTKLASTFSTLIMTIPFISSIILKDSCQIM